MSATRPHHDYDVIVAGAGPAGSSAAYGLARAGLRVLILEKEQLPRYKTCGGGLPGKVAAALPFDFSATVEHAIFRGRVTSEAAGPADYQFQGVSGWMVMRDCFDHFLAEQAVAAGARLRMREAVQRVEPGAEAVVVETAAGRYAAAVLVGADGVNGMVARAVGLAAGRQYGAALEAEIEVSPAAQEAWRGLLHIHFGGVPWGYAWVFPKARHFSVGVGTFQTGRRVDLRAHLRQFLAGQPLLREYQVRLQRGYRIPLGGQVQPLHQGRVLLAGDAGGFADPFLGEGIYYAIRSGQLAGQVASQALAAGGGRGLDLSEYTRLANARYHSEFRFARLFAAIFYRIPHVACRLNERSQAVRRLTESMLEAGFSFRPTPLKLARLVARVGRDLALPA